MIRKIIQIDETRCNGCGACAVACHEGAITMVNGKAKLMRDDYCDGLGDCLPNCPTGAITFVEREAAAYDEAAVLAAKKKREAGKQNAAPEYVSASNGNGAENGAESQLVQWPCQIKLVPVQAPYFHGVKLLIAADCTAYAYARMHQEFMKDHVTIIGCPKLDGVDYSEKLTQILRQNEIREIALLRMEVPCCGGLEYAAATALKNSEKNIQMQVTVITTDGKIKEVR